MQGFDSDTPVVMTLSSHDPTGSAGIQADIETTASLGCHCTPIVTALCAKDTRTVKEVAPTHPSLLIEQARAILEDMPVRAIKLGMLGSVENIEAIHTILGDYPQVPVVLSPVIAEFNNELFDAAGMIRAMQTLLLPHATLVAPDLVEARELAQQGDTLDACAHEILETGCQYVLISGARRTQQVYGNSLYGHRRLIRHYQWPRLQLLSHGAGATLAAGIASYLAHGFCIEEAVEQGQQFTWRALSASRQLGMGTHTPNRMHWADRNGNGRKRHLS